MRDRALGVDTQSVDRLQADLDRAGLCRLDGGLERLAGFLASGLQLGIGILRLLSALFGELTERFGELRRVERSN